MTTQEGNAMPDASASHNQDPDKAKAQTAQQILLEIQTHANSRNFVKADALRERLIEKSPAALSEIIKSAEIIEKAKTAGLDRNHLAIWSNLYEDLTDEERNCLFYSMKKFIVPPKRLILKHGAYNNRLFFIDRGQITVFHSKGDKKIILAQLGRGAMIGEYTFTTISLCSASAASHSEVELMCLENSATDNWPDKYPGLYDKVINFCQQNGKIDQIIRQKEMKKRRHTRYDVQGAVTATLLNKEGQQTNTFFKGTTSDISIVGSCMDIRCSKRKTAQALLSKTLHLTFRFDLSGKSYQFAATGKVVRVSFHLHNDYSVHIKFIKDLKKKVLLPIVPKR